MAHLAGLHHRIERVQGFLDRRLGGAVLVPIAEAAEVVGGAVRPVELIEVDMVRLQPLQARLDRRLDVLAVEARLAATDIGEALSVGADALGGDDNLAAGRSEERRVGKACVSPCRSRWSPYH